MKTACNIPVQHEPNKHLDLLIEIGQKGISCLWHRTQPFCVEGLLVYTFDEFENHIDKIRELIFSAAIKEKVSGKISVAYNFNESMLVPEKFFNTQLSDEMLFLQFGDNQDYVLGTNHMKALSIYNLYRVPLRVHAMLKEAFPNARDFHSTTIQASKKMDGDVISCIVFYETIKVLLYKEGALQFVQQFNYKTPEDAVYHLLNSCQQHDMHQEKIKLRLSGMIVKDSFLFESLYNYFLDIDVEEPSGEYTASSGISELPSHFLNHLTELATCEL